MSSRERGKFCHPVLRDENGGQGWNSESDAFLLGLVDCDDPGLDSILREVVTGNGSRWSSGARR